jgi:hypothetical protein
MPITLAQARELSQDKLTQYVIDEFRKSALLDQLPFDDTATSQGGQTMAYVYNRVKTMGSASTRAINTEYTASESDTEQITATLKIFGGSFEIDRVIAQHEKKVVDHVQFQLQQKIDATRAKFHDLFINGDSGSDATEFDGIKKVLTGSSTEVTPSAAIDLSTSANIDSNWKKFLDQLRKMRALLDKAPTLFLMNSDMFAVYQSVMDRAGINLASKQNYGDEVLQWGQSLIMALGDKPGTSSPIIPTTAGETDIYATRLALDGVHGISPDGTPVIKSYLPDMKAPGAVKKGEVEMIAALAIKASRSAGVLHKVKIG